MKGRRRNRKTPRATRAQLAELRRYVVDYRRRGVIGVWDSLATSIDAVLGEITEHRRFRKERAGRR